MKAKRPMRGDLPPLPPVRKRADYSDIKAGDLEDIYEQTAQDRCARDYGDAREVLHRLQRSRGPAPLAGAHHHRLP